MQIDLQDRCQRLSKQKTLENLFTLTCENQDAVSALYIGDSGDICLTYRDNVRRTYAAGKAFRQKLGQLQKGSFVAISMDTSPLWFPVFWGLIAAGYNALLLDPQLSDEMTAHLLAEAGAKAIISKRKRVLEEVCVYVDEIDFADGGAGFAPAFADKIALCTSGTTATSRIFVYDQSAVCEQVLNALLLQSKNRRIVDGVNRRSLAFLPFHHVFGLMVNLLWAHFIGYETVYLKNRVPETILSTTRHFHVNFFVTVPLLANSLSVGLQKKVAKESRVKQAAFKTLKQLSLLIQTLFPEKGLNFAKNTLFGKINDQLLGREIDCIILGGSHTPKAHMKTLSALGYYTVSGFGMTETAITSVETSRHLHTRVSGSVGRPLSSVEYMVKSDGKKAGTGEMLIRGKSLHTGQLKDGQLLPAALDENGWYPTGDIVRLEKGMRMYVEGRSKDLIINESGENVYPDEIEDVFQDLHGVDQLCVLGLKAEGGRKQRRFHFRRKTKLNYEDITLVLSVGDFYRDDEYQLNLMRRVSQQNAKLPVLKKITRVIVTPEKFDAANGIKVKRLALKERIEKRTIAFRDLDLTSAMMPQTDKTPLVNEENAPREVSRQDVVQRVRRAYAETLGVGMDAVGDHAHFITDLGGDSLQILSLTLKIEEMFGLTIPEEDYGRCATVDDLSTLLIAKMQGSEEPKRADTKVKPVTRFEDAEEYRHFMQRYEALMGEGAENPYFVCHESALTDKSLMDGQLVLNFGSYNYVGMSGRRETREAAKQAIDRYGTSASGSRLLAGEKKLYQELEKELADWKHAEDALVLVGGHSTNVTMVGNFCGEKDLILYDALAHNSVAQGTRLSRAESRPFPHNDVAALENILKMRRPYYEKVLIVIEGAYSMDGDVADVPAFVELKKKYGCFLMVDEAHSACVLGETGGGVDEHFRLAPSDVDIKMGTLSKGLGTCGGYLAGSRAIIEYLRYNLPGFVFSVGISPPLAAACLEAIRLLRNEPSIIARLHDNIRTFTEEARARHMNTCLAGDTAIIPILVGSDEEAFLLSNLMRRHGVFVPPAVYPAVPRGKARLRFCVNSEHTREQIILALDTLLDVSREAGIALPE